MSNSDFNSSLISRFKCLLFYFLTNEYLFIEFIVDNIVKVNRSNKRKKEQQFNCQKIKMLVTDGSTVFPVPLSQFSM